MVNGVILKKLSCQSEPEQIFTFEIFRDQTFPFAPIPSPVGTNVLLEELSGYFRGESWIFSSLKFLRY
jgi:hypothetical protein